MIQENRVIFEHDIHLFDRSRLYIINISDRNAIKFLTNYYIIGICFLCRLLMQHVTMDKLEVVF